MSAVWALDDKEPTGKTRFRRKWFGFGPMVYEQEMMITEWDTNCPRMSERKVIRWEPTNDR